MWVFTRYGFVSIACASKHDGSVDEARVMVRARLREHLENLCERFPNSEMAKVPILNDAGTDYRFRVVIPKSEWATILNELALEQTWTNFKNEASRFARLKKTSSSYVDALHDVWQVMARLQHEGER
ncbi:MAG TPA: hypothetical protein VGS10_21075 [Terracidiphilus sp.]|nr:hypothetical protein [Terracidiphilus sp.]